MNEQVVLDESASGAGPTVPTRRNRRWLRRVFVALVLVAVLFAADWYEQNREMAHLLDAVQRSEKAMDRFKADTQADIAPYTDQCSASTSTTFECQRIARSVGTALSDSAATDLVDIQTSGVEVGRVSIWPWHNALRDARSAYSDHSSAWEERVRSAASDPSTLWDKVAGADINATFETAHRRFDDALTPLPLFGARQRIEHIWAH